MEEWITKEKKVKNSKTRETVIKTTKYRVDPEFVPTNINEICEEFIANYVKAHNETEWAAEVASRTVQVTRNKGKEDEKVVEAPISYTAIRSEFVKKFFPQILKSDKKKPTLREQLLAFGK